MANDRLSSDYWDRRRAPEWAGMGPRQRVQDSRPSVSSLQVAALDLAKQLFSQSRISEADIGKMQTLLRKLKQTDGASGSRAELVRFMVYLATRDDRPSPDAGLMPAPVSPNGGPKPLSGAAEAPLD